jgi:hypothetical protein
MTTQEVSPARIFPLRNSRTRHPDRFARTISSQLKHCRIAAPGLPLIRFFGSIACSLLHLSVV